MCVCLQKSVDFSFRQARCSLPLAVSCLSFEFPRSPANGTPLFAVRVEPLGDALQVEGVPAGAPDDGAVIAGVLCVRCGALEGHAADTAHVIPCIPRPGRESVPFFDGDLERGRGDVGGLYHGRRAHRVNDNAASSSVFQINF